MSQKNKITSKINHFCISPALFRLDGGAMYGIIPRPLWQKVSPPDEQNRIDLDLRLWLIQTKDRNILIDTGIGDYHGEKFDERFDIRQDDSPLEKLLVKHGISAEQITDLVISHLHFDHVGGLAKKIDDKFVNIFSNAIIHLHIAHFEYSKKPTQRDAGSFHQTVFMPILEEAIANKRVNWLNGDDGVILKLNEDENLNFLLSNGHTPYLIHPYTSKFIYLADIIPTSNHISVPWVMGYDISPGVSTEDKVRILDFVIENNLSIIFEHDTLYWGAKISKDAKHGYVASEKFSKTKKEIGKSAYIEELT